MPTVNNGDVVINVWEEGRGAPLMLVHGIGLCSDVWINQVHAFAEQYRVLAVDLRGFGKSSKPRARRSYVIERFVDDLAAAARQLDAVPMHFVGTSLGGFIGQRLAVREPRLLKSLVLCHTASETNIPATVLKARLKMLKEGSLEQYAHLVAGQALAGHPRPAVLDWFIELIERNDKNVYAQAFAEGLQGFDVRKQIGKIAAPTLVVIGELDRVIPPKGGRETARLIRGAKSVTLKGVGHCGYIERPHDFNSAVLGFIDKVEHGAARRAPAA
ncbi:MAG: alpha/beta fold hydrolase [Candidatus Binataceae bacterium]